MPLQGASPSGEGVGMGCRAMSRPAQSHGMYWAVAHPLSW